VSGKSQIAYFMLPLGHGDGDGGGIDRIIFCSLPSDFSSGKLFPALPGPLGAVRDGQGEVGIKWDTSPTLCAFGQIKGERKR
jgi:hypothetical protein